MIADHPIPVEVRSAIDATEMALIELEGLIIAADLARDQCEFTDMQSPYTKALATLLPMAKDRICAVFECRSKEWYAMGGK